jgi:hypothetical protein
MFISDLQSTDVYDQKLKSGIYSAEHGARASNKADGSACVLRRSTSYKADHLVETRILARAYSDNRLYHYLSTVPLENLLDEIAELCNFPLQEAGVRTKTILAVETA